MDILRFPLGQMQANCYLLQEGNECLLIDPGDDAPFLLEEMRRKKAQLVGMIATHGHFDHVMAVGEIQLSYAVPFYIREQDMFLIDRLEDTARHFLGYEPVIVKPKKNTFLLQGTLQMGPFQFEVIETPGHTPGSASFYLKKEGILFTGDTLFKRGIGRFDFSYSDKNDLLNSVETILEYPKKTKLFSGHGEETTVEEEIVHKTKELLMF